MTQQDSTQTQSDAITTQRIPEVLAPVGGREQFFAALNSGADAVFLGLKNFNARARAENFTIEDLRELVPLAQRHDMKVLVTMNILIKNSELEALLKTLHELEDVGVHAIIVQDLGLARICREFFPRLRLHASTQMAIHNLDGVREALKAGMKRVVLARELTALEIKKIKAGLAEQDVEIEVFCHGSLCYSYSGLCFFSGAEDARSGNRGECAYTCRKPYKIINEPGHGFLFSMKDLNTVDSLHLLVGAGVDALKIEGRKKDAQYVSSVIQSYRKKLDQIFGRPTLRAAAPEIAHSLYNTEAHNRDSTNDRLQLSFQRESTTFFLKGRYAENVIDLNNPTHKGQSVGVVQSVSGQWIEFTPECELERFDGLRIDPKAAIYHSTPQHGDVLKNDHTRVEKKYQNNVVHFSLRRMEQNGRPVTTATAGQTVRVELPEPTQTVSVGDCVIRTRSDALRRDVERISKPSSDFNPRAMRCLDTRVALTCSAGQLECQVTLSKQGTTLVSLSKMFPAIRPKNIESSLANDLGEAFGIFGNIHVISQSIEVVGDARWFIPRSKIKEFKRELEELIPSALENEQADRIRQAWDSIATPRHHSEPHLRENKCTFAIKIDRLEYLDWIALYLKESPVGQAFSLGEIVFEPKRAFLKETSFEAAADALHQFRQSTGASIRLAFPTVLRAWDEPLMRRWYETFVQRGISHFEAGNLGVLGQIERWPNASGVSSLSSDFTLYTLNSVAAAHWKARGFDKITLSVEDDHTNLTSSLSAWPEGITPQVILYKDTPLFIAESCSLTALHNGCPTNAVCGYRTLEIENENKERFFVAHESCKSIVYDAKAYSITHKRNELESLGIRHFRIDFLTRPYTASELTSVLDAVVRQNVLQNTHTANFNRRLL